MSFLAQPLPPGARAFRKLDASGYGGTFPWLEAEREPEILACPRPDGAISFFGVPFAPALVQTAVAGDRLAAAWTADYRIALLSRAGDTLRVVERAADPVPTSGRNGTRRWPTTG